ncbi:MAG: 2Fe-2S iron-sulfur cluster binding domain-containing protein [Alphaproteobacteria bacterium]|nr:2Fe-2S iron-sulfur cluster binding domain-containing protein [Alphaproteobacteria bacterium]
MKSIALTVNGEAVRGTVEPRTSLADFLREDLLLTGAHLGCEQGVCGACTVMIDGAPARSCIALAVACDGTEIRTIEGFDDDPRMAQLRAAFTKEHALQCGYCTPGMLISSHDIVSRLPDADEARVREELSGNLCRCTGYVGIVRAVRSCLGETVPEVEKAPAFKVERDMPAPAPAAPPAAMPSGAPELLQSFTVAHRTDAVWAVFQDIEAVATCMPGVSLTAKPTDGHVEGQVAIKLGPIAAAFAGTAQVTLDDTQRSGVISGQGRDSGSGSSVRGEVTFTVVPFGAETRVDVTVAYALTGALGQFARGGIVNDLASRLTADFSANLQARLEGRAVETTEIAGGSLFFNALWSVIRRLFGRG